MPKNKTTYAWRYRTYTPKHVVEHMTYVRRYVIEHTIYVRKYIVCSVSLSNHHPIIVCINNTCNAPNKRPNGAIAPHVIKANTCSLQCRVWVLSSNIEMRPNKAINSIKYLIKDQYYWAYINLGSAPAYSSTPQLCCAIFPDLGKCICDIAPRKTYLLTYARHI